jgi:hypothetical protein
MSNNNDAESGCGCVLLCLFLGVGWFIVNFIQSHSSDHFSEEPYFVGGTHSNLAERKWLEEAEQKWLAAQSGTPLFGHELSYSFPIPPGMAGILSEQGYGNIINRPQREREAIYRQAAPLEETGKILERSSRARLEQLERILDTGCELECIVAEMTDTERDIYSQKYYELLDRISNWIPVNWKTEIRKSLAWDIDKSDPKLRRAIEVYQSFVYAASNLDATASSGDLKREFGLLGDQSFPRTLNNYLRLKGTDLFHTVDDAIADGYRIGRSTVYKSNLFGYGTQAPGSNAADAIPVHSQQGEDSFPAGAWLMDSTGRSYQKREPQRHYF